MCCQSLSRGLVVYECLVNNKYILSQWIPVLPAGYISSRHVPNLLLTHHERCPTFRALIRNKDLYRSCVRVYWACELSFCDEREMKVFQFLTVMPKMHKEWKVSVSANLHIFSQSGRRRVSWCDKTAPSTGKQISIVTKTGPLMTKLSC